METRDYIIVGLSVALTLTLVAVIIVLVNGKAQQLENPRYHSGDIMDEVNAAINRGEVVAPNVIGIDAEVRRRQEEAAKSRLSDAVVNNMAADYLEL
ncbi:hypothetical protein EPVG_00079 [Emiliania huxleyi virus 201]|nr:hypothetical protein ELVG_00251 [Emiliania huxleyi virus 203]AEP15990.1 hypothetical protein ERVG_00113 [Emiliania huxleyi virus 208]AET97967.1 hypothetical protein EPVG_00079 [Emiliania huxleyi virus 201]